VRNVTDRELVTPGVPAPGPVTSAVGGAFIVGCAVTAALSMEIPDAVVTTDAPRVGWHYPPVMWPLLLTMAGAGAIVMTRPRWARPAAVVAAIVSALAAGNGLATIHRWFTVNGLGGLDGERHNLVTLHAYAAAVALAATAATVAAAAVAWREWAGGWRGLVPSRPGYVAAGAAVAVLLPVGWNPPPGSLFFHAAHQIATLTYALPWAAGLAAAGWLRGRTAVTAGVTVAVSAVLCIAIIVGADLYTAYMTPPDD
jgi:hypothetical protein